MSLTTMNYSGLSLLVDSSAPSTPINPLNQLGGTLIQSNFKYIADSLLVLFPFSGTSLSGTVNFGANTLRLNGTSITSWPSGGAVSAVTSANGLTLTGGTLAFSGSLYMNCLNPTGVKTANYNANANNFIPVDTTSGNVIITLPTTPSNGTLVGVKQIIQGGTNTIAINTGGSDVFNKSGGSTSLTITLLNQGCILQYYSGIWYVLNDDLPLSQLDSRYSALIGSSSIITLGTISTGVWHGSVIGPTYGGTGIANNSLSTLTISGNYGTTFTVTNTTSVTLPTSGTLVNTAVTTLSSLTSIGTIGTGVWQGTAIGASYVSTLNQNTTGSAASLSISGQIGLLTIVGLASTNRIKIVRDAADTILELGGSYSPGGTWTSMTFVSPILGTPTSGNLTNCTFPTLNQNTTGTANNITASSNTSLTSLTNLATVGTIGTGIWNGTLISPVYGGTGVANNISSTLTISGSYGTTFTVSGTTSLTLPTSGTVCTTIGSSSIVTVGSVTSGSWQASLISSFYGGTGVNNSGATITIGNNITFSGPYTFAGTLTAATAVTFPTSGTLCTITGSSSITTVGTIGTGTWQGTVIGVTYGGTGANLSATGGTGQFVKQTSLGGILTVAAIAQSEMPSTAQVVAQVFFGGF